MRIVLGLMLTLSVSSCALSPGSRRVGYTLDQKPRGDEEVVRGVVNGLYDYAPDKTFQSMANLDEHLPPEEVSKFSKRYVVRVGIDRAPVISVLSPVGFGFKFSDYVILPEGWSHNLHSISEEAEVINVGDIVDVRIQRGRYYDYAISLVRQCFEPPLEDENPDWNIGCKVYEDFNEGGYAGEQYIFRPF